MRSVLAYLVATFGLPDGPLSKLTAKPARPAKAHLRFTYVLFVAIMFETASSFENIICFYCLLF
jgi:hypothetical protein